MRLRPASVLLAIGLLAAACTSSGETGAPLGGDTLDTLDTSDAPSSSPRAPASPRPPGTPPPPTVDPIDAQRAMQVVTHLVDGVGERLSGSLADARAQAVIAAAFADAGWDVTLDRFDLPQGGQSANVVATWRGRGTGGEPHVVVGGHYDTVPGTVGANDNATGVGVLVAVAHELADEAAELAVPVVLVAFGAEEYQAGTRVHHVGSEHMASAGPAPVAMLSVDMVGNGPTTRLVAFEGGDPTLWERLQDVVARAGIADTEPDVRGDVSDHGPFARRGIPAAFLWTGPDGRLHTPADTLEHVTLEDLQRAGDVTLALLRDLGDADVDGLEPAGPG